MATNNMINTPEPFAASSGGSGVASPTAHGVLIAEGSSAFTSIVLTAGQVLIGTTASDPAGATLSSGTGVSITSASGAITINATGGGLSWSTITGATASPAVNTAIVINDTGAQCVITLPATAALGSKISIRGLSTGMGWVATANTGQTIQFGNQSSSSAGSWGTTVPTDSCDLECIVANTTWTLSNCVSAGLTKV